MLFKYCSLLCKFPGGENGNPLQWDFAWKNLMDRRACLAKGHEVAKSRTQLGNRVHPQVPHSLPFCFSDFLCRGLLVLCILIYLILLLLPLLWMLNPTRKSLLRQMSWRLPSMFTSRSFMVLDVIIKFLINWIDFCICYNIEMGNIVLFLILEKKLLIFHHCM